MQLSDSLRKLAEKLGADRFGIKSIVSAAGLFFAILLLVCFIYLGGLPEDRIFLSLSLVGIELLIGAVITLTIIERALEENRDRQWAQVKKITYYGILSDLRQISALMAILIPECGTGGSPIPSEIKDVLWHPSELTEKQVSSAILKLYELLRDYDYCSRTVRKEPYSSAEWLKAEIGRRDCLLFCYAGISKWLDEIRLTFIPRVLQLSRDQEANLALIELDLVCSRLQFASVLPHQVEKMSTVGFATCEQFVLDLIDFIKESGRIYNIVEKHSRETDLTIKADEAGAYYSLP